jgi:hypothetical protein
MSNRQSLPNPFFMAITGIKVADECIPIWNDIKLGHKYRYVIFSFSADLATVAVETTALLSKTATISLMTFRYAMSNMSFTISTSKLTMRLTAAS